MAEQRVWDQADPPLVENRASSPISPQRRPGEQHSNRKAQLSLSGWMLAGGGQVAMTVFMVVSQEPAGVAESAFLITWPGARARLLGRARLGSGWACLLDDSTNSNARVVSERDRRTESAMRVEAAAPRRECQDS